MDFIISRDEQSSGALTSTYRVSFIVTFSEQELAVIRSERLTNTVVYDDPPLRLPRFRDPIQQHLSVGDLVKRRPNVRTFSNCVDADMFERQLREKLLPLTREMIQKATVRPNALMQRRNAPTFLPRNTEDAGGASREDPLLPQSGRGPAAHASDPPSMSLKHHGDASS